MQRHGGERTWGERGKSCLGAGICLYLVSLPDSSPDRLATAHLSSLFCQIQQPHVFDLSAAFVQLIIPFLKRFCCLAPRTLHSPAVPSVSLTTPFHTLFLFLFFLLALVSQGFSLGDHFFYPHSLGDLQL